MIVDLILLEIIDVFYSTEMSENFTPRKFLEFREWHLNLQN